MTLDVNVLLGVIVDIWDGWNMVHLRLENSGKCACFGWMIEFFK